MKPKLKLLVILFASQMYRKLSKKQREGWSGWDAQQTDHWNQRIIKNKIRDLLSGDAPDDPQEIDVANYAAFLWAMRNPAAFPLSIKDVKEILYLSDYSDIPVSVIKQWKPKEMESVVNYVSACLFRASDNKVKIPPKPAVLLYWESQK